MQDSVNPSDFDWQAPGRGFDLRDLRRTWEEMMVTETEHSDATKKVEHLNDDLQLLFVSLLLEHVDEKSSDLGKQRSNQSLCVSSS